MFNQVDVVDILRRDSHVLLQGLSGTGEGFLQVVPLVMYYVKITLFASTPRSVYKIKYSPRTSKWGTLFPQMTQLVVITFGQSIISPIINGLAFGAFLLFYFLYKYLFTWVNDQPPSSDTGGLFFPKAMNHIFVGLYIQQIFLCGLFFLSIYESGSLGAIPEGALMVVLIVFTVSVIPRMARINFSHGRTQAFSHNIIHNSYGPLIKALPLTLADRSYNRVEPDDTTTGDVANLIPPGSGVVRGTDYANVSTPASYQPVNEREPLLPDDAIGSQLKRVTDKPPASPPSLLAKLLQGDGPVDFRHPATVEEQRVIWLLKDPLGLVKEIEQDLDSRDILHSTDGAEIDEKGQVDVTLVLDDAQDAPTEVCFSPPTDEGDDLDATTPLRYE